MSGVGSCFFLPGWAAPGHLYAPGLPGGWRVLDPPGFRAGASLEENREWLQRRVEREAGQVLLAGHSMGGALALLVAAARPDLVSRLLLFSPAGLPIVKPVRDSASDFVRQLLDGLYPPSLVARGVLEVCRAPRSAVALARGLRALDLGAEMLRVRSAGTPAVVVGCTTDTLVPPSQCRRAASLLGAGYREIGRSGGHMWMLGDWPRLRVELRDFSGQLQT